MATPTYELIDSTTFSSTTASFTFSSIPSTFTDIVIVASLTATAYDSWLGLRFQGNSSSAYSWVSGYGSNQGSSSSSDTEIQLYSHITTTKGLWVIDVRDYADTDKQKMVISRGGSAGSFGTGFTAGRFLATSAITSITLFGGAGLDLEAGGTIALYGIAG